MYFICCITKRQKCKNPYRELTPDTTVVIQNNQRLRRRSIIGVMCLSEQHTTVAERNTDFAFLRRSFSTWISGDRCFQLEWARIFSYWFSPDERIRTSLSVSSLNFFFDGSWSSASLDSSLCSILVLALALSCKAPATVVTTFFRSACEDDRVGLNISRTALSKERNVTIDLCTKFHGKHCTRFKIITALRKLFEHSCVQVMCHQCIGQSIGNLMIDVQASNRVILQITDDRWRDAYTTGDVQFFEMGLRLSHSQDRFVRQLKTTGQHQWDKLTDTEKSTDRGIGHLNTSSLFSNYSSDRGVIYPYLFTSFDVQIG